MAGLQVRSHFRPEFINRIDEFTVFKALQRKDIKRIVILQARRVEERLQAKKMKMKLLEPAIEFLAVCVWCHQSPACCTCACVGLTAAKPGSVFTESSAPEQASCVCVGCMACPKL